MNYGSRVFLLLFLVLRGKGAISKQGAVEQVKRAGVHFLRQALHFVNVFFAHHVLFLLLFSLYRVVVVDFALFFFFSIFFVVMRNGCYCGENFWKKGLAYSFTM